MKFNTIMRIALISSVAALVGGFGAMVANEFTLKPMSTSRVYSTREVTESSGWRLVVDGKEFPNEAHLNGFFWDYSNKPERFFQVVTWEGCFGLKRFRVEKVVTNEIRRIVNNE